MFSIRRKIGTGATSRRRLSRQCKPEVDGMETRALLSILVSAPGSPIVESGTPTNLNVSFDEHGHGFASLTNPATGALLANPVQLQSNLINGVPVAIPGIDLGPGTTTTTSGTILIFGQTNTVTPQFTASQSGGTTTLTANNIDVTITNLNGAPSNQGASFILSATNVPGSTNVDGGHITENFQGTFSIVGKGGPLDGQTILSGKFNDTALGNVGGTALTLTVSFPGSPDLTFNPSNVIPMTQPPVGMSLAFTDLTNTNPATPNAGLQVVNGTIDSFVSNVAATFSGSQTVLVPPKPPLIYKLPTAVNPGDVAVYDSQTGQLSDVLRFTDTVNITTNTVQGWVLVYSDFTTANPADAPADTFNGDTLAGLPPDFNQFSPFNGTAYEFGVEGFNLAEYAANQTAGQGPEQAFYSFLSDGNLIPSTGG